MKTSKTEFDSNFVLQQHLQQHFLKISQKAYSNPVYLRIRVVKSFEKCRVVVEHLLRFNQPLTFSTDENIEKMKKYSY